MNTEQFTYKNREQYLKALDHEPPKSYFKIRKLGFLVKANNHILKNKG